LDENETVDFTTFFYKKILKNLAFKIFFVLPLMVVRLKKSKKY